MENLIFCLNATVPVFLTMLLGMFFKKIHLLDDSFTAKLNQFVFTVSLPVLLFQDMAQTDFAAGFDGRFLLFCFFATALSILIAFLISFLFKDRNSRGEFVQAAYRSSAALLGIAFIQNIYGSARMAPVMILGSVPLYNIAAVFVLTVMKPGQEKGWNRASFSRLMKGIATNPILLGIAAGSLWSLFRLPQPPILEKTLSGISATATPLGLMAMGASFQTGKALSKWKEALACTSMKLIGFAALFLPLAISMGFVQDKLISILVMLASPTTVSCFIMAKNMGYDGSLTASVTLTATLLGAFTLTGWLFVLKTFGLL